MRLGAELFHVRAARQREHADMHFAELSTAARLLPVSVAAFGFDLDRFAERDLRFLGVDFQFVAAMQAFANDHQVQFTHAGDDQFLGLSVAIESERGVFIDHLMDRAGQLRFVAAALRTDGQADHRSRKGSSVAGDNRPATRWWSGLPSWRSR